MSEFVYIKAYDDSIVRVPKEKQEQWFVDQQKIKSYKSLGLSDEQILHKLNEKVGL